MNKLFLFSPFCTFFISLFISFGVAATDLAVDREVLLQKPIQYGDYITAPKIAVLKGMKRYSWTELEEGTGNSLIAQLLYKGYDIRVNITYANGQVLLSPVLAQRVNCSRSCRVNENSRYGWTVNLRKSIAKELHVLAIRSAIKTNS